MSTAVLPAEPISQVPKSRWARAVMCWATFCVAPFGWFLPNRYFRTITEERLDRGLVLILPGIEGRSFFNLSILHGLVDGGLPYALEIVDWTTGNKFLTLYHLRAWRRNLRKAQELADRIVDYQAEYPGRPVWIVGHSGGGAMALLTTKALPAGHRLTGLVLLSAAISPRFPLAEILPKVERGIWNFHSWMDFLFVGVGTTLFGTVDGWHMPSAGMIGFWKSPVSGKNPPQQLFVQHRYHPRLCRDFNFGGHFGCVHRVFIAEHVANIIADDRSTVTAR